MLDYTSTIKVTEGQMLDIMDLERERNHDQESYHTDGYTLVERKIHSQSDRYSGHVDFSYEEGITSIAACEGCPACG